jgi:S1-C subfamily serine protease
MKFKHVLLIVVISSVSAIASVWGYSKFVEKKTVAIQSDGKVPANYAGFFDGNVSGAPAELDFTKAASASVQAVVHIKTKIPAQKVSNELPRKNRGMLDDWFDQFFDFGPQMIPEQRASGSGVLISEDGYIVTNNHVISDQGGGVANEITVTLHNKKTYKARLIGKDPSSDLAVLKIDGTGFPYLVYGNSEDLKLGQWVLAVGYPLTLETTVTAGIVSAKGRSIGINSRQSASPVESFIQTDAAVNQGNSGGALVTTDGKLIGINSAILAPSGTYAGYSFAIPINLAKKMVNDIIEFGDVQRGYLGIQYAQEMSEAQMKELGIKDGEGVYVSAVPSDGGAYAAGIKKGDIITKVNNVPVSSGLEMSAQIASFRPKPAR